MTLLDREEKFGYSDRFLVIYSNDSAECHKKDKYVRYSALQTAEMVLKAIGITSFFQGFPDGSAICVCVTGFGGPRCEDYLALSRPLRFDEYNDPQMSIYQYGFPDGILLRDVAAGTYNQESYYWIFTSSLNQCKRRQPQRPLCVWDEMVEFVIEAEDYAHNHRGADVVPFGLEELVRCSLLVFYGRARS